MISSRQVFTVIPRVAVNVWSGFGPENGNRSRDVELRAQQHFNEYAETALTWTVKGILDEQPPRFRLTVSCFEDTDFAHPAVELVFVSRAPETCLDAAESFLDALGAPR